MSFRLTSWFILVCLILLTISYCFTLPPEYGYLNETVGYGRIWEMKCVNHTEDTFAKVDRICEDCFRQYRDMEAYNICRENCFGTVYFSECLLLLTLIDEKPKYLEWILELHNSSNANISWT